MNIKPDPFRGFFQSDFKKILLTCGLKKKHVRSLHGPMSLHAIMEHIEQIKELDESQWDLLMAESRCESHKPDKMQFINEVECYVLCHKTYMEYLRRHIESKYHNAEEFYLKLSDIVRDCTVFGCFDPFKACDRILDGLRRIYAVSQEFEDYFRKCLFLIEQGHIKPLKISLKLKSENPAINGIVLSKVANMNGKGFDMKRKSIPKIVREQVWKTYINTLESSCLICDDKKISAFDFECGHVDADGLSTVSNLRPICKLCNCSMRRQNMKEFAEIYFPNSKVLLTF